MGNNYFRVKLACYSSNVSMAVVSALSPLLFLTFKEKYDISYSLLGLLVLINFVTQLLIDVAFSLFSHRFNVEKTVKLMPVLCFVGLIIFGTAPMVFSNNVYLGLCFGTVIFSASCGLGEVLISPIVAHIPSENPEKEMSVLHSAFAWGVVGVVVFSTCFLKVVGDDRWYILVYVLSLIPLCSFFLFFGSKLPKMKTGSDVSGVLEFLKNGGVWLCILAIFTGGAAECTMSQWASGYIESALRIPKIWGDIFGVALFAAALGLGRSFYAKKGKNIFRVLIWGSLGASLCYLLAALSPIPVVGLFGCAFTGFCVSMLWPGNLVVAAEKFPEGGVVIYALMASGGDLGASVGPQLVGIITDFALNNEKIAALSTKLGVTAETFGMKSGMLVGMIFPIVSLFISLKLKKTEKIKIVC